MPVDTVEPPGAAAPRRPWWAELGGVVPRAIAGARKAAHPDADRERPPLATNPLAWATVAVDELALSTAYLFTREQPRDAAAVAAVREAAGRLAVAGLLAQPQRLLEQPAVPMALRRSRRHRAGIDFEHVSFTAPYVPPVELPGSDAWAAGAGNATVHAYLLRHGDRPRPWVLVLHGHRMGEPRDLRLLGSRALQRSLGVDVAHLVLPLHGPRGRGDRTSFPGLDGLVNLYGMVQAVQDARALLGVLRGEAGGRPIGAYGISLGGHVAALLAAVEPDLACVVAGVPTSDLAAMLEKTVRAHWGEAAVEASGVRDDAFRALSAAVSPLSMPVSVPRERRFVYAAVGDRLVTPDQASALWRHWDRPAILWLQGGHILNNVGASRRFLVDALAESGVRCVS